MKVMLVLMLMITTNAIAADMLQFKNGVKFSHLKHQVKNGGVCSACHEQEPGKIAGFGKEYAHRVCIDCHDTFAEGPVECVGCHTGSGFKAK